MHDDDDIERNREIAEYLWKPGKREEIEREQAERRARIERDEVLQWAKQRAEAREGLNLEVPSELRRSGPTDELGRPQNDPAYRLDPVVVTKGAAAQAYREHAPVIPASMSKEWAAYIKRAIKKEALVGNKAMAGAIAQTIGRDLIAVERRCDALREEVDRLTAELGELKGELKTRAALAEVTERFDRLETTRLPTALKAIS